jgi:hypothetical protein
MGYADMYKKSGDDKPKKNRHVPRPGTIEEKVYNDAVESGRNVEFKRKITGGSKMSSEGEDGSSTSRKFDRKGNPKGHIKIALPKNATKVNTY